jgi:hypothetical protein
MPQQRDTSTDRLANVIQVIQLGRKTGVLTVERGNGITTEEGSITFVNGQATQASAGQHVGLDAFNWLSTWGVCRFAFLSSTTTQQTAPLPSVTRVADAMHVMPAFRTQPQPQPLVPPSATHRIEDTPLTGIDARGIRKSAGVSYPVPITGIPVRTRQMDEAIRLIEQLGLSRTHRRLFLLIDGQRTTTELVRLMGREPDEVQRLLRDLEKAGVIQP